MKKNSGYAIKDVYGNTKYFDSAKGVAEYAFKKQFKKELHEKETKDLWQKSQSTQQ